MLLLRYIPPDSGCLSVLPYPQYFLRFLISHLDRLLSYDLLLQLFDFRPLGVIVGIAMYQLPSFLFLKHKLAQSWKRQQQTRGYLIQFVIP